ncbi:hypothetical protein Hanom_Chr10g00914951 [Helianthus anomalus]
MSLYALLLDEMRLSVVAIPPHQLLSQELRKESFARFTFSRVFFVFYDIS